MSTVNQYLVITGGPGSGKSTLIDKLRRLGFAAMPEAGRAIIRDQTAIGGHALHTADRHLFAELMLAWEMRSYHEAPEGTVFFDRGIPDIVGYHLLLGRAVPGHVSAAADLFRYDRRVFLAPPWKEIYLHDSQRGQDFTEAVRTYDAMLDAYQRHNYEPVILPKTGVTARIEFLQDHLNRPQ